MITIAELLAMPVGERIGGGFMLTVKTVKKTSQLPNKDYIFTVVLFDKTGEMLADFKRSRYIPLIRNAQVLIVVAEIQTAEKGTKLFVHEFDRPKGKSEPDYYQGVGDDIPDWETTTKGKIRHGLVCSLLRTGKPITLDRVTKINIEKLVDYIFTGE